MFLRMLKTLSQALQEEAMEKIDLFQNPDTHRLLKVHKLQGRLAGKYSFSVNYSTRIIFQFTKIRSPRAASLLAIGDHAIYR